MKRALGYGLLAFAAISVAYAVFEKGAPAPRTAVPPVIQETTRPVVIARYCHGNARCSNCIKIENYSREAVETGLRKELDSGRLRFETVNVDESANRHFIKDYGLYTKSLVLVRESGGKEVRHKVLTDVWDHLDDKDAFIAYVRKETEEFLK
ncbi:MAG: nitrophenyl compound nitroreductase subunit ArsF family protein [Elusimicrobiota bacterium]